MAKDYTSLLGRDSGASFGDIASAYLTGNRKIKDRGRAALLLSMFVNMRENRLRDNVLTNLEDLDNEKSFEIARVNKQWEDRQKLVEEYEGVQNKTAYVYYKDLAEQAFTDTFGTDSKYDLEGFQPEKIKWMKNWTKQKEDDLNTRYKLVNTDVLTKEEFSKPITDYYRAKRKDILNPQNRSVVHRALGKIGFGTDRSEETGNFLDKKGVDVVEKYRNEKETFKTHADNLTTQDKAEIKISNDNFDESPVITQKDFNTLIADYGILSGSADNQRRAQRAAYEKWNAGNKTYQSATEALASVVIGYDAAQTKQELQSIRTRYIEFAGPEPKPRDANYDSWQRGLKSNIAKAYNMEESISVQRMNLANEVYELGLSQGLYNDSEKTEVLKDITNQYLMKATGAIDYNQLKADIIREKTLENLIILQEDPSISPRTAKALAQINQISFTEQRDRDYLSKNLDPKTFQKLSDLNFNMTEFNKIYFEGNSEFTVPTIDKATIFDLQTSMWLEDGVERAILSGNNIVSLAKQYDELAK
jgi:hypothetical protein